MKLRTSCTEAGSYKVQREREREREGGRERENCYINEKNLNFFNKRIADFYDV
jgi:hypothetical protein